MEADDWVGLRTIQISLTALPADCLIQGYTFHPDGGQSLHSEVVYYWKQSNGALFSSIAESDSSSHQFFVRLKQPVEDGVLFASNSYRKFPESDGMQVASGTWGVRLDLKPKLELQVQVHSQGLPVEERTEIYIRVRRLGRHGEWVRVLRATSINRTAHGHLPLEVDAPRTPFDMRIEAKGFSPKLLKSLQFDGTTAALQVELLANPIVTGKVTLGGIGLANATVKSQSTRVSTTTDAFGDFTLEYESAALDKLEIEHDQAGSMYVNRVQVPKTGQVLVTADFPSPGQIWGDVLLPSKELLLTRPGLLMTHIKSRTTVTIPILADGSFRLDFAMPGKWKIALAELHEEEELGPMGYLGDFGYTEVDAEQPAKKLVGKLAKIKHRRLSQFIRLQPGESKYLKLDFTK